ncbi:hypothetical protein DYB32_010015 [Aphanomyces invadans]|uniref:Uncharacterized protein n=1 Tax=Aphanomyces invadans TaxID=157072 RepID=A0A3R6VEF3_9STRA|nr:hypothetical protein DYB32_010015 [Aphanomyces invadans]
MNGANAWKGSIPEVSLFAAFLAEKGQFGFGKSDLSLFLHARQLVMNCVGDLQALGHDDMPQLTSTQAQNIVHCVFQTLVHGHRHLILAKLEGLLKPITHLPEEDVASVHQDPAPQDKLSESPSTLPCFNFQGLPASTSAASSGHFPQGNVKKAIPSHVPDPKTTQARSHEEYGTEEKWIDVHQLLLFCVLEFREERRRFFTDMQVYVANKKLREDVAKATDGTVLVDCQHLMCMALQYYTNLFALARFTDGLSVDQTEVMTLALFMNDVSRPTPTTTTSSPSLQDKIGRVDDHQIRSMDVPKTDHATNLHHLVLVVVKLDRAVQTRKVRGTATAQFWIVHSSLLQHAFLQVAAL